MLLSHTELVGLVERGVITNVEHDFINASSIDLTLGSEILVEVKPRRFSISWLIHLAKRTPLRTKKVNIDEGYILMPGEFILASTQQQFNLPLDISGEYKLKSSMARIGLEHLNAGWCDGGWHSSVLTLELKNMTQHHAIGVKTGDRIGQIVFFKHAPVPADRSYAARGRYNGDQTVQEIKE